jgi:hypothetical protein
MIRSALTKFINPMAGSMASSQAMFRPLNSRLMYSFGGKFKGNFKHSGKSGKFGNGKKLREKKPEPSDFDSFTRTEIP